MALAMNSYIEESDDEYYRNGSSQGETESEYFDEEMITSDSEISEDDSCNATDLLEELVEGSDSSNHDIGSPEDSVDLKKGSDGEEAFMEKEELVDVDHVKHFQLLRSGTTG
ncbi:unnamed protein product [Agarophyton chilense]